MSRIGKCYNADCECNLNGGYDCGEKIELYDAYMGACERPAAVSGTIFLAKGSILPTNGTFENK